MTEIIIKKRKTLSLNRTPKKVKPVTPPVSPQISKEEKELNVKHCIEQGTKEKQQRFKACRSWLFSKWPEIFDKKNVRPLALGIYREIQEAHAEDGGEGALGFGSVVPIKRNLARWCGHTDYLKAVVEPGAKRYSLRGEAVDVVTDEQRDSALSALKQRKVKVEADKVG
jgi:sRNA-binding protein